MNRSVAGSLLLLLLPTVSSVAREETRDTATRPADHVVLISVDALRPEFYLDTSWPAPMLQRMAREGSHASAVEGVYPTVTYPSHTTIVTGVRPATHGIFYNSPFEPEGATGRWYWEAKSIQVPTLWDAARAAGLTTANVSWPVSVGAPVDWNLPEIWSLSDEETTIDVLRRHSSPSGLWDEIERQATGRLTMENFSIERITRDDRVGDIAAHLLTTRRPNLLLVHLIEVDHFQHQDGRDSTRVRRALATVDSAISQIVEAAEAAGMMDRTTFVVAGDHGMIDVHTRLAPNVWLADADLRGRHELGDGWRATFHTSAASAFLYLADPNDVEAVGRVREILAGLEPAVRAHFEILERDDLDRLAAAPPAALGLALAPGVDTSSTAVAPAVEPHGGSNHGYLPSNERVKTGFLAWGAGVRRGIALGEISLLDIAPLVARLLDLSLPATEGHPPPLLESQPPEASSERTELRRPRAAADAASGRD